LIIEASADYRNVLRHSLESCPSLVSPNLNKPSIFTKMCRQHKTCAAVLKALRAGRNLQEIARFLKVHRSLVYLLKKVLNQIQDIGEADATSVQINTKKVLFATHRQWICGLATQNTAKITLEWLKANLMDHCPRKSCLPAQN
jgi:hypothetical protein